MRVLVISDLHGSEEALRAVLPEAELCDLVLYAGDLTDFGGEREARRLLELLEPCLPRLAAVPGNCDRRGARAALEASGSSAEGRLLRKAGFAILGSGGAQRRSGLTPYERPDEELASDLYAGAEELSLSAAGPGPAAPLLVLSHAPPRGSGADLRKGEGVGSPALAVALERLSPLLWACGHIHESPFAGQVGETLVANPGPLREGRYAIATLDRDPGGGWRASAELLGR